MKGRRKGGCWWAGRREEWRAVRQIMHRSALPFAWLRLSNRIITHPGHDMAEWVRTRTLVEAVYAERAPRAHGARWLDARTRYLLVTAIRHLPEHERVLAGCELAVLDYHDRHLHRLARLRRWATGVRLASVLLGFVLLGLGLGWSGIVAMIGVIIASYGCATTGSTVSLP